VVQRACVSSPVFCPRYCWRKKPSRAMTKLDFESNAARPAENIADILFSAGVVAITEESFQWVNLAG
jgi:hypothetical protein